MKKTYFYGTVLFLMIVTGLFVLVSCGGGGGSGNVDSPDVPAGEEGAGEGGGGSAPASVPASISLATSQVEVKSDNSDSAIITATVLDENNAVVEGARVSFTADGGQLSKSSVDTDENGEAQTQFSCGTAKKSNRTVTITAKTGTLSAQIPIRVTGTKIDLSSDTTSLMIGDSETLAISVQDAASVGIYQAPVTLSASPAGILNLSPTTGSTDISGKFAVQVTGAQSGSAIVTAQSMGATANKTYTVSATAEMFSIYTPSQEISSLSTGSDLTITVKAPTQSKVQFATTIGTFTGCADGETGSVINETVSGGYASAILSSNDAGLATVQVLDADDPTKTDSIKVAISAPPSDAEKVALQANALILAPSTGDTINSVTLSASVKNDSDQVVGNAPVMFSIEKPTGGGEFISPDIVYTDDYGVATSTFTSGSLSSDAGGVTVRSEVLISNLPTTGLLAVTFQDTDPDTIIRAAGSFLADGFTPGNQIKVEGSSNNDGYYTIAAATADTLTLVSGDQLTNEGPTNVTLTRVITDSIQIVIGGTAGSVVIGRGTKISSNETDTAYILPMSVLVADGNGNPVDNAEVSLSAWPVRYITGVWVGTEDCYIEYRNFDLAPSTPGVYTGHIFDNEDVNRNLTLDPGEDSDTPYDPAVANSGYAPGHGDGELTPPNSAAGTLPRSVRTDENGVANFNLVYLKASSCWIETEIKASTLVYGTETISTLTFVLPYKEGEECSLQDSPYNP